MTQKAKLISTGETVEVCADMDYYGNTTWFDISTKTEYYPSELEFPPEEYKEVTIEGWVLRDDNNHIGIYRDKPTCDEEGYWDLTGESYELFPDITPEAEPKRFRITITPIEE